MSLILVFRNISGLAPTSDYEVDVMVGDGTKERSHIISHGHVRGHLRTDGWLALVQAYLDQQLPPEQPKRA